MAQAPTCPRCGYDLSGIVASWTNSCPLTGICSECGLAFRWRDLLDPRFLIKPLLFEQAQSRLVLSFFYTLWRAMRPWSFWSWVRMEDQTIAHRLRLLAILGSACMMAAMLSGVASLAWAVGFVIDWTNRWWSGTPDLVIASIWPAVGRSGALHTLWLLPLIAVLVTCALSPGLLVLFGPSFRIAKVKGAHLRRVWAYSLLHLPVIYAFFSIAVIAREAMWVYYGTGAWSGPKNAPERAAFWIAQWGGVVAGAVGVLWFTIYLRFAVGRYLRLPTAVGVAVSVGIITALFAALFAVALWYPYIRLHPYTVWSW